jgi:AraC-like DNA-binding protein
MKLINSDVYLIKSPLVREIYTYIDSHIYEKITLKHLSDYCQKSKHYLSEEFKKYTGLTIHYYVNQRKIKEAIHILLFTSLSSIEIASKLSFSDQSHFIQTFKRFEGLTPKEYRQKYKSTRIV